MSVPQLPPAGSPTAHPMGPGAPRPGRGLIAWGAALMAIAVLAGGVLVSVGGRRAMSTIRDASSFDPVEPTVLGSTIVVAGRTAGTAEVVVLARDDEEATRLAERTRCELREDEAPLQVEPAAPGPSRPGVDRGRRVGLFPVREGAVYRLSCAAEDTGTSDRFTVIPSIGRVQDLSAAWFVLAGIALGFLLGVAGLVLLIIGVVRHNRAARSMNHPPTWPGPGGARGMGPGAG